jgi:hypothetical protein
MAVVDLVLIGLIFLVLVGFLVLAIFFGTNLTSQVTVIGNQIEQGLLTTFNQLQALGDTLLSTLTNFYNMSIKAFDGLTDVIENGFSSIATFVTNTLVPVVEQIVQQVTDVAANLLRVVAEGTASIIGNAASITNNIITFAGSIAVAFDGLVARTATAVSQIISSVIQFLFSNVTTAIIDVITGIEALIAIIKSAFATDFAALEQFISQLYDSAVSDFANLEAASANIENAINQLPTYLNIAYNAVTSAITNIPHQFACILKPLCCDIPFGDSCSSLGCGSC